MAGNSGRPFQPKDPRINRNGPVGNHALGFARRVREATRDGQDCIDFAVKVRDGKVLDQTTTPTGAIIDILPPVKVRLDAARWLVERGFGRMVDVADPEADPLAGKSERQVLGELLDALPAEEKRYALEQLRKQMPEAVQ